MRVHVRNVSKRVYEGRGGTRLLGSLLTSHALTICSVAGWDNIADADPM